MRRTDDEVLGAWPMPRRMDVVVLVTATWTWSSFRQRAMYAQFARKGRHGGDQALRR